MVAFMSEICDVEMEGHLIDSLILTKALDKIMDMGGEFEIKAFRIGEKKDDTSYVQITVMGRDSSHLDQILLELHSLGARLVEIEDAKIGVAPSDMVVPKGFYSTTNHPTYVRYNGSWAEVENNHMDCLIVLQDGRAVCTPLGHIKKGDCVVVGTSGVKVVPPERPRQKTFFSFMSNEVSSERPSGEIVKQLAGEIISTKRAGGKIAVVCGPAVVHTGAAPSLAKLIRDGYVDVLLAGNAIAVHDIERQLFGTSLGMNCAGNATSGGHRNHLYAISEIMASGSIRNAIDEGKLKGGIIYRVHQERNSFHPCRIHPGRWPSARGDNGYGEGEGRHGEGSSRCGHDHNDEHDASFHRRGQPAAVLRQDHLRGHQSVHCYQAYGPGIGPGHWSCHRHRNLPAAACGGDREAGDARSRS